MARAVESSIRAEVVHGLFDRHRCPFRKLAIFSRLPSPPSSWCRGGFDRACALSGDELDPLADDRAKPKLFSNFLLSSVSDLFFTSYLADVKLPFSPS